jgi:hypothetical protein
MFKRIARDYDYSAADKAKLFHDTAARVYKIGRARPGLGVQGRI